jgi:serine/threonine-protein kinase RsbW
MKFPQSLNLQIPSVYGEEKKVLQKIDELFLSFFCLETDIQEFKSAVAEACINAIEHGNLENRELPILISITLTEQKVSCTVCDKGSGFTSLKQKDLNLERGWGLEIIESFVDSWTVFQPGDDFTFCIQFEKRLNVHDKS